MIRRLLSRISFGSRIIALGVYGGTAALNTAVRALLVFGFSAVLKPPEIGVYSVAVAVASIMGIVADSGFSTAITRTYYDWHHDSVAVRNYLSGILLATRVISFVLLIALSGIGYVCWSYLSANAVAIWPYLPISALIALCDRQALFLAALCRVMEKPRIFGFAQVVGIVIMIATSVMLVFVAHLGAVGALLGLAAGSAISAVLFSVGISRTLRLRLQWPDISQLMDTIRFGVPLLPNQIITYVRPHILRMFLIHAVSASQVGIFFISTYFGTLLTLPTLYLDFVFSPFYFKRRIENNPDLRQNVVSFIAVVLALLAPAYIGCALFVGDIVPIIFKPAYAGVARVTPIIVAASFLQVQQPFLLKQLTFLKKTTQVSLATALPALIGFATVPWTAAHYGIDAAAWTLYVVNFVTLAIAYALVSQYEKPDFPWFSAAILSAIVSLVCVTASWGWIGGWSVPMLCLRGATFLILTMICVGGWVWPKRHFMARIAGA